MCVFQEELLRLIKKKKKSSLMATRIIIYSIKFLRSTGIPRNFESSSGSPGYSTQTWLNPAFLQNSYHVKVSIPAAL